MPVAFSGGHVQWPFPCFMFRRGDANSDSKADISDAAAIFGFLFLGAPRALSCMDAADSNDSGKVDISDGVRILNYLFLGVAPPPWPGPANCALDPTLDELPVCQRSAETCSP